MEFVELNVDEIVNELRKAAQLASNEEELRIRTSNVIEEKILKPLGIYQYGKYEYTLVSGARVDALYGHVLIEYKRPGFIASQKGLAKAREQLIKYIQEEATTKEEWDRYLGVILSDRVAFVRYDKRRNEWLTRGPYEIRRESVIKLIEALRGLRRKSLYADELLKDFGPESDVAKKMIKSLYLALRENIAKPKVEMLFKDWKRLFSQATGYSPEKLKELKKVLKKYGLPEDTDFDQFLFSLYTYYALLMKIIAAEITYLYGMGRFLRSFVAEIDDAYTREGVEGLRRALEELENGSVFRKLLRIVNFVEGDYFSWYLDAMNEQLAEAISLMVRRLADYEPATPQLEPEFARDLLKRLYQEIVPRDVRHKLGEFYTPDWLADLILNEVGLSEESLEEMGSREGSLKPFELRVLDPACGSGTFLIQYIRRLRKYAEEHYMLDLLPSYVLENVVGFDLNPLAVIAARTNYLLFLADLLGYITGEIRIPVYLADSLVIEREGTLSGQWYILKTSVGEFKVPADVVEKGYLDLVLTEIENMVQMGYSPKDFRTRIEGRLKGEVSDSSIDELEKLYEVFLELENQGKNKVWASILRNAFAPLTITAKDKFDFVIGNPPWINWENLPEDYRELSKDLWIRYGLFKQKGTGLGKVKKDLAMLFLVRAYHLYLKEGGKLGFLMPFTVFKTQAGAGFRSFLANRTKIVRIHDLVTLYPFEGAVNRTSAIILEKGEPERRNNLMIPHTVWINKSGPIPTNATLEEVMARTERAELIMTPIADVSGPWAQLTPKAKKALENVIGRAEYNAHAGVYTGFNQIYFVKILDKLPNGSLVITNPPEPGQKKKVKQVTARVEADLVYPLLRGRDVEKWFAKIEDKYIIVPHSTDGRPIPLNVIRVKYPQTYEYFHQFQKELEKRSIHRLWGKGNPFYAVYDIGDYTFKPYKVVWKYIAGAIAGKALKFECTVVEPLNDKYLGERTVIPHEKLMLVPFTNAEEAYYVCGVLNSTISRLVVASYVIETEISTHILYHIQIPKYIGSETQKRIAELSKKAHELAKEIYENGREDLKAELAKVEEELDKAVAELYGITEEEFKEIKRVYDILKGELIEEEEEIVEEAEKPSLNFLKTDVIPESKDFIEIDVSTAELCKKAELTLKAPWGKLEIEVGDGRHKIGIPPLKEGKYELEYTFTCGDYSENGEVEIIAQKITAPRRRRTLKLGD